MVHGATTKTSATGKGKNPSPSKHASAARQGGSKPPPSVQTTTAHQRAKYRAVLESTVGGRTGDDGEIVAYSGTEDSGFNQTRDRSAKLDIGVASANVIKHADMSSDTVTTAKALHTVWVRMHGIGTSTVADDTGHEETKLVFYEENKVTHAIKSLQTWLTRQGPHDVQFHCSVPFKYDALPDNYSNGATQIKSYSHSAVDSIPARGDLLCTTSKPGGSDKSYPYKLFPNINDPATPKPTDLYLKVLEFVVSRDELCKFGDTSTQAESIGLHLSCMMTEETNPRGKPSTAPDMLVEAATFIPNEWPTILPPTNPTTNLGEIKLLPSPLGFGAKLGSSLRLNEKFIYTSHASTFGIATDGGVVNPRYVFCKDGYAYFALTEQDAFAEHAVGVAGAVVPHSTNFRPLFPKIGAFGGTGKEYGGTYLPHVKILQLLN